MGRINWFPGHMVSAFKQVQRIVKQADIVLEVRDARVPFSSGNSKLNPVIVDKRRIVVLNKGDVADALSTEVSPDPSASRAETIARHLHAWAAIPPAPPGACRRLSGSFGSKACAPSRPAPCHSTTPSDRSQCLRGRPRARPARRASSALAPASQPRHAHAIVTHPPTRPHTRPSLMGAQS